MMFTKLEKQIILFRLLTMFAWLVVVAIHTYFFSLHFIFGFIWLFFLPPVWIWYFRWANLYFPKKGYFRCYYRQHSKEDRQKLSENSELFGKYTIIGDVAFLDDVVIIKKTGIVLEYDEIKKMSYNKEVAGVYTRPRSFAYVITFDLFHSKAKYKHTVYYADSSFIGNDCQYSHALAWIESHRSNPSPTER